MAAGDTITQSLADSLDTVAASARQVREYEGVMPNLVDKVTLDEGSAHLGVRSRWPNSTLRPSPRPPR
jgi:hypothetical protein